MKQIIVVVVVAIVGMLLCYFLISDIYLIQITKILSEVLTFIPFILELIVTGIVLLIIYLCIRKIKDIELLSRPYSKPLSVLMLGIVVFWVVSQVVLISSIEIRYGSVKSTYEQQYLKNLEKGTGQLNSTWEIAVLYWNEFYGTYGKLNATKPNRILKNYVYSQGVFIPILTKYLTDFDGLNKLVVVQKKGNCGEFAESLNYLLNDTTGLPTRIVSFEGVDHTFPEVYINGDWWVFDKIYTTPNYPVKANNYASFLEKNSRLLKYVANLKVKDTGKTVLWEHGFTPSNLTILAIRDMTTNPEDDKPVANANVEIFTLENQYDPLVAKGNTNESGVFITTLNSQKSYVVLVKLDSYAVGIVEINGSISENKTVRVYLHKYE